MYTGLQITVGLRTMTDQNLLMSDEIATLVGYFDRPMFCCNIWLYHLQIKFDFLICYSFECTSVFMSDQIFLLSDQNGALVGQMSFQGKKNIFAALCICNISGAKTIVCYTNFVTWRFIVKPKFHCIRFEQDLPCLSCFLIGLNGSNQLYCNQKRTVNKSAYTLIILVFQKYSWLLITRNLALTRPNIDFMWISVIPLLHDSNCKSVTQ